MPQEWACHTRQIADAAKQTVQDMHQVVGRHRIIICAQRAELFNEEEQARKAQEIADAAMQQRRIVVPGLNCPEQTEEFKGGLVCKAPDITDAAKQNDQYVPAPVEELEHSHLLHLAAVLALNQKGTDAQLIARIKEHLDSHVGLADHPRFQGLYTNPRAADLPRLFPPFSALPSQTCRVLHEFLRMRPDHPYIQPGFVPQIFGGSQAPSPTFSHVLFQPPLCPAHLLLTATTPRPLMHLTHSSRLPIWTSRTYAFSIHAFPGYPSFSQPVAPRPFWLPFIVAARSLFWLARLPFFPSSHSLLAILGTFAISTWTFLQR
ncbi:hypothetical protein JB92DRAFT_3106941 [Gautieria morchelliformis]|nr:hypothetical protein JB92DRAFT_3106941 [Gautieria morchelliformis]